MTTTRAQATTTREAMGRDQTTTTPAATARAQATMATRRVQAATTRRCMGRVQATTVRVQATTTQGAMGRVQATTTRRATVPAAAALFVASPRMRRSRFRTCVSLRLDSRCQSLRTLTKQRPLLYLACSGEVSARPVCPNAY